MPRLFLLLLLSAGWIGARAQVWGECKPSVALRESYIRDVTDLAAKRMYAVGHPDTAEVRIPQPQMDSIWRALGAVFMQGPPLQTDSVFAHHCIHTENAWWLWAMQLVIVEVDDTEPWTDAWINGQTVTGYGALDSFCARYGYLFSQAYQFGGQYHILLSTPENGINDQGFADSLRTFSGVLRAARPAYLGDGDHLEYSRDDGGAHLSFTRGWYDCPAGCRAIKTWHYTVVGECAVTLDSVSEIALEPVPPPPMRGCGLRPAVYLSMPALAGMDYLPALVPNPTDGALVRVAGFAPGTPLRCEVVDARGVAMQQVSGAAPLALDASALSPGVYVVRIRTREGVVHTLRLVRR